MRRTTVLLAIALLALGGSVAMASGATESGTTGPVKLTMWADAFEKSFPAGVQDDPVAKELERLTGVALDITPMNAVGNYNDKLAAALASNDLPDIAIINDATILPKIVSSRAALALDPYLEKYAPNYTKVTPQRITYARDILGRDIDGKTDGKVYFLTLRGDYFLDPLQAQVAPYLRYDLWAKLGYPKVESMDDYITVLQNMMKSAMP